MYNGSFVHPYSLSVSLTISLHLSAFVSDFLCLSSFETGAHYVFLSGLELTEIHLPLFSKCWYKSVYRWTLYAVCFLNDYYSDWGEIEFHCGFLIILFIIPDVHMCFWELALPFSCGLQGLHSGCWSCMSHRLYSSFNFNFSDGYRGWLSICLVGICTSCFENCLLYLSIYWLWYLGSWYLVVLLLFCEYLDFIY